MRPGAGKRKGSGYERAVGRRLSLWLTHGRDATQLIRSVSSGGWSLGISGEDPWRHVGDLAPNGPEGERFRRMFAVECKHHAVVDLWQFFGPGRSELRRWWDKLNAEVERANLPGMSPMIVVRANHKPEVVVVWYSVVAYRLVPAVVVWQNLALLPLKILLADDPAVWMRSRHYYDTIAPGHPTFQHKYDPGEVANG